jgi:hypothetical protein
MLMGRARNRALPFFIGYLSIDNQLATIFYSAILKKRQNKLVFIFVLQKK